MSTARPASAPAPCPWWLIGVTVALIAALYAATLREGHAWGGDNAMYVMHARNLLAGRPYAETPYLYNPASGRFPVSYPPVFPALLAPVLAITAPAGPPDWQPLKLPGVLCLAGALTLLAAIHRETLQRHWLLAAIGIVGLDPVLWDFKDRVFSEFPFLLFVAAALWIAERAAAAADRPTLPAGADGAAATARRRALLHGVALGLAIYLAYGTRSVGALLLPAVFASEWIRTRRVRPHAWVAAAVFAPLFAAQGALLHSELSHLGYKASRLSPQLPLENLFERYPPLFLDFFRGHPALAPLAVAVAGIFAIAILGGMLERLRQRRTDALDAWVGGSLLFFLAIHLGDSSPPQRYWIPLFPFFVFQAFRTIDALERRARRAGARARLRLLQGSGALLVAATLLLAASRYPLLERGAIADGITSPDALALYAWLRTHSAPDDALIFFEPRVLALYTGRPSSELRVGGDRAEWMAHAERIGARYWVRPGGLPPAYRDALTLVYANPTFSVFRFDRYR